MYAFPIISLIMIIHAFFLIIDLRMIHIISKKKLIWIRIYIDKTYINQNYDNLEILNKVLTSIEKCVKSIEEIIKVRQIDKIKFTDSDIHTLGFNNNEINPDLLSTGEGISSDLIIFPKFEEFQQNTQLVLAIGKPVIFDSVSKRPIGAILSINKNLPSIPNSENYLNSVIMKLGFLM